MKMESVNDAILRFFRDDVGGILITGAAGEVIYEDAKTSFIRTGKTNWKAACPRPAPGQKGEAWDLLHSDSGKTYYSKTLKTGMDHDGLTGLSNKGKFLEMKRTLFRKQETLAVFNMDVNNLKHMNDTYGHETGDRLIRKAADSLKHIQARNIMPFRVGGDEFVVVAIHVGREEAERIRKKWEEGLAELNRRDDGVLCEIACGFAFGEDGFDPEEIFALADRRMYEDKKAQKLKAGTFFAR